MAALYCTSRSRASASMLFSRRKKRAAPESRKRCATRKPLDQIILLSARDHPKVQAILTQRRLLRDSTALLILLLSSTLSGTYENPRSAI